MFMILVTRVVKKNTGAREKFAPRTANDTTRHFCGPFQKIRSAERAMASILATHTALDAVIWSEAQVREQAAKSYSENPYGFGDVLKAAVKALDSTAIELK